MGIDSIELAIKEAIGELNESHSWQLTPADQQALFEAIAPLLSDETASSAQHLQTVIYNFYWDGAAVHAMLNEGSADGEAQWTQWYEAVSKFAAKKGVPPDEAIDLVHSTYSYMQRALQNFKFECRLTTYWYAVFNNRYCKWLEQKKRRPQQVEIQEELISDAQHLWMTDTILSNKIVDRVRAEIQKLLKSTDYTILFLYYIEQTFIDAESGELRRWTDAEIGNHLDMPLNTITSRRLRTLKRLRENPQLAELFQALLE